MKYRCVMAALAIGMLIPTAVLAEDKIDKEVVKIVKQTGDFYKNAKSLHAEGTLVSQVTDNGEKREIKATAIYDVERPNLLSLKTQLDGDAGKGPDVIADGKKLFVYGKAIKQYVQEECPESLGPIGLRLLPIGPAMTGMMFANILADDPSDLLMQGVNSCSYVGKDKVDGVSVHRMKFSQDGFDWEMWVATEGKPLILRMIRTQEGPNGKVTTTETYKNWKIDAEIAKNTFKFVAPEGATKVDEFKQP